MSIETREYDINFFKESIIGRKTDEVLMEIEKGDMNQDWHQLMERNLC